MIERVINMKKKKKYVFETIKILILIFVAFYILSSTIEVKKSVFDGLQRCIQTIIPSLYAVMALSGIIARSCILEKISSPIDTFSRKIFGMNGNVFIIFLMSMVSGYPVGVKMLSEMYEKGNITKKQCELYSGLCYGAGPAFITGCAASSFTGNYAGKIILISNICANMLIAIFLGKFIGMEETINCRPENSKALNVSKLRYHKIVIMTDADIDGSHISTLILTFFFRYMKELIEQGYIYIAQPPLYLLKKGNKKVYAYNEKEREEKTLEMAPDGKGVEVQRYKGLGEMNPEQLWETTLNPENRILKQVTIESLAEADNVFSMLMGDEVPPRREFIEKNAVYANIDA